MTLFNKMKAPCFRLKMATQDLTSMLGKYVSGISVTYGVNRPATASVNVTSSPFLEDFFLKGTDVEIYFGENPFMLNPMFSGKVTSVSGGVQDMVDYTIECQDRTRKMSLAKKNRVFPVPIKASIVQQIVAENGLICVTDISDIMPLPMKEVPLQKNLTDLEFLHECAKKWDCLFWDTGRSMYFVDSARAFMYGDIDRIMTLTDLFPDYKLGYRTDFFDNNIKKLSWSFAERKGSTGMNSYGGSEMMPMSVSPEDFSVPTDAPSMKNKPSFIEAIKSNPINAMKMMAMKTAGTVSNLADEASRKYFYPVTGDSRTNKNLNHYPEYRSKGIELSIELNSGDIYLRPPRTAILKSGTSNPKADNSDLPAFLSGSVPRKYNITEVTTGISDGAFSTSLKAVL